ncbi:uncharacterized protein LOC110944891 [Helianthus annuus]|uniref:uncharacterized protein LOC110944891 n=1 Tax=Helianthus annuus TaxID=4232 RepID=UPI000B8FEC88|nr:uncharacterized protein LOC110944891 [Helianthus annuus]
MVMDNHIQVCAITETHVEASKVYDVCKKVCRTWNWTDNGSCCTKGMRIIVGWDANLVDVMVLDQFNQVVHTQVVFKPDQKSVFCSFVYAENHYKNRRQLWDSLKVHQAFVHDKPWVVLGDFNTSLYLEDHFTSSLRIDIGMTEFKDCVNNIEVFDMNSSGMHYTWSNKQQKDRVVYKKIDRIMGNMKFIDVFPAAAACFHPWRVSYHTPCILVLPNIQRDKPKPFKFVNLLTRKLGFIDVVKNIWSTKVDGYYMFQVIKKLKLLKTPMRKLLLQQGNIHEKVKKVRKQLDECQKLIDADPGNEELMLQNEHILQNYKEALNDEALFLQQKSKVDWISLGDSNTKFFHNVVKAKNHRSRIFAVRDANGNLFEGGMAPQAMVDHFSNFSVRKLLEEFGKSAENSIRLSFQNLLAKLTISQQI